MAEEKNTSTYAVKLDGEVKEELQALLEGYKENTSSNAGDFIKTLLEVYKTNKIVSKVSNTDKDIKELNQCTSRIYDIYNNLIKRNETNNSALQMEFTEQLNQKDNEINNLKAKLKEAKQEQEALQDGFNNAVEEKTKLENEKNKSDELNISYKLNISKLQEENEGLLIFKEENNKLSNKIKTTKELLADSQAKNIELNNSIKDKDDTITGLNATIESNKNECASIIDRLKKDHVRELQTTTDKLLIEKDKAILELKQEHQKVQEELNIKYNNKINEYQNKYKELLLELEQIKKVSHKRTTGTAKGAK